METHHPPHPGEVIGDEIIEAMGLNVIDAAKDTAAGLKTTAEIRRVCRFGASVLCGSGSRWCSFNWSSGSRNGQGV